MCFGRVKPNGRLRGTSEEPPLAGHVDQSEGVQVEHEVIAEVRVPRAPKAPEDLLMDKLECFERTRVKEEG